MAEENTMTAKPRPRQKRRSNNGRRTAGVQVRIMAYGVVSVGAKGFSVSHVYAKATPSVTRCELRLGPRGVEVRETSFSDYSEAECQSCCELFGVSRLWQIYPPMNLGEHLWDERGRRR